MSELFNKIKDSTHKLWLKLIGVYTVEEPIKPISHKCTCGRSSSGNCEGLHVLSEQQWKSRKDGNVVELVKSGPEKTDKKVRKPRATKQVKVVNIKDTVVKSETKKPRKSTKKSTPVVKPSKKTAK